MPSRVAPILKPATCARPWFIATMFSLRVSVQCTGRPSSRASQPTITSSTFRPFAPKPPPTSGPTTRICVSSMPSSIDRPIRSWCGVCVESQIVSRPSSPGWASDERGSSGLAASRWLTSVPSTTTSQPSNRSGSAADGTFRHVFVPISG